MESTRMHGGEGCGAYLRAAKHPALIVFDLDGTIADSRDMARESYKRVFAMMGYGMITDELADSFNGPDADEVCRVMGIGPDRRELYDKLVDQNDVELMSTMGRMFPGTIRMLDELAPHATLPFFPTEASDTARPASRPSRYRRISRCTAALSAA